MSTASTIILIGLKPAKTVPRGVSLTSAIDPRALKHANITLNVDWSGNMALSGFFRVRNFHPDKSMKPYSLLLVHRSCRITSGPDKLDVRNNPFIFTAHPGSLTLRTRVSLVDRKGHISGIRTSAVGDLATDTGNGIYGPTFPYPFTLNFPATTGLSGIAVGDQKFPLQDSLFIVPTLSSIKPGLAEYNILDPTHLFTFNITAAVSNTHPFCSCV